MPGAVRHRWGVPCIGCGHVSHARIEVRLPPHLEARFGKVPVVPRGYSVQQETRYKEKEGQVGRLAVLSDTCVPHLHNENRDLHRRVRLAVVS